MEKKNVPLHMMFGQMMHLSKYAAKHLLKDMQLKPGQAGVLFVLNGHGKLSQRELAEKTGVKPPSMTVAIRKMEDMGYVEREPDERDQRIIRIALTEKGKQYISKISEVIHIMEETMFQGISEEEQTMMRRLLIKMQENLCNSGTFKNVDMENIMNHPHCSSEEDI